MAYEEPSHEVASKADGYHVRRYSDLYNRAGYNQTVIQFIENYLHNHSHLYKNKTCFADNFT